MGGPAAGLTLDQAHALVEKATGSTMGAYVVLSLLTGLGQGRQRSGGEGGDRGSGAWVDVDRVAHDRRLTGEVSLGEPELGLELGPRDRSRTALAGLQPSPGRRQGLPVDLRPVGGGHPGHGPPRFKGVVQLGEIEPLGCPLHQRPPVTVEGNRVLSCEPIANPGRRGVGEWEAVRFGRARGGSGHALHGRVFAARREYGPV